MQILVFIASLLFIFNKMLLLDSFLKIQDRIKWSLGLIAAILFIVYFFLLGSPILSTLEIGLTILMLYRTIVKERSKGLIENLLGIITSLIIIFLLIRTYTGYIETVQFLGAFGMLLGTYKLIQDKQKTGFSLYAIGHIFTVIYGYQNNEFVFWWLQLLQALMCLTIFISNRFEARHEWLWFLIIFFGSVLFVISGQDVLKFFHLK